MSTRGEDPDRGGRSNRAVAGCRLQVAIGRENDALPEIAASIHEGDRRGARGQENKKEQTRQIERMRKKVRSDEAWSRRRCVL